MKNYKVIIAVTGRGYTVPEAVDDLVSKLNQYKASYDFINPIVIVIDREVTPVSRSYIVFAIQMLGQKQ